MIKTNSILEKVNGHDVMEDDEKTWLEVVRKKLRVVMKSKFMYWLVIFVVFCNSVSAAVQHYRQPQWITDVIVVSDFVFMSFFFVEMCFKLFALTPREYFSSKFNTFDFIVVVCGIVNLVVSKLFGINLGVSVLRQLRLLRLFKFTQHWSSMKNLVNSLLASMTAILSLLLLLFLFLMISALLGMQLFGGYFQGNSPPPRTNFDDFFNAMLAVFQIITGEDWNYVMYEGIKAHGGPNNPKGMAHSLYFVGVTVLGNYVLLNVFLAIAVDNLTTTAEEEEEKKEEKEHMEAVKDRYRDKGQMSNVSFASEISTEVTEERATVDNNIEFERYPTEGGCKRPEEGFLENLKAPGRMTGNIVTPESRQLLQVNTLFIFTPSNPIRIAVHRLVTSPYFDNIILTLILISSVLLACEDVCNPDALQNTVLLYLDYGFTSIFALEVLIKIINYGFILHRGSYCRSGWNVIDMLVVSCAITSLILTNDKDASPSAHTTVKILRILRVLRPLKSINKLPKLKAVFQCMIYSLKNVVNILMITLQFLFIFSVMGIQLFMGKFWQCNDLSREWEDECQGTYIDFKDYNYHRPNEKAREWTVYDFNFDNLGNAMLTLFTSSTGEGWPTVMQSAIDSQDVDQGPKLNNKLWISIYFVVFVIIFSFFFINIFVGMIILTFQNQDTGDSDWLNKSKRDTLQIAMQSRPLERYMPHNTKTLQYHLWVLIESNLFEGVVMGLIVLNTIAMMMDYYDQAYYLEKHMDLLNDIFTFVFIVELFIKLLALRAKYFKSGWNNFDMLIVLGSLVDFTLKKIYGSSNSLPFDPSIFRLFRAARIVKLLRRSRNLRILIWTFMQSFKALPYVAMLISLLFFVYGIFGVQMFALISINNTEEPYTEINRNNHFRTYFSATQVLFRVATGENWPNIMLACRKDAKCDPSLPAVKQQGIIYCGNDVTYFYFISFVFFCSFLMLNLFIAVIMDSFAFLTEDSSILGPHHLDEFTNVWSEYDPGADGRIQHTVICDLLRKMLPPIGLGRKCNKILAYKRLVVMNMRLYKDGTVDYNGTFFALVRTGLSIYTDGANLRKTDLVFKKKIKETWPKVSKRTLDLVIPRIPKNPKDMTIGKIYAAKLIWENYKNVLKTEKELCKNKENGARYINRNGMVLRRRSSSPVSMIRRLSRTLMGSSKSEKDTFEMNSRKYHAGSHTTSSPAASGKSNSQHSNISRHTTRSSISRQSTSSNTSKQSRHSNVSRHSKHNIVSRQSADKHRVAEAIRMGQSPYRLYGLKEDADETEDWC